MEKYRIKFNHFGMLNGTPMFTIQQYHSSKWFYSGYWIDISSPIYSREAIRDLNIIISTERQVHEIALTVS